MMANWKHALTEQIRLLEQEAEAQRKWQRETGDPDACPERYQSAAGWAKAVLALYTEKERIMLNEIADALDALGAEDVFDQARHLRNNDPDGLTAW